MKIFSIIRKSSIYLFCIGGWVLIYYILLAIALNGGTKEFSMNHYNEMWIELITVPILLIVLIIFIILEVKHESWFI